MTLNKVSSSPSIPSSPSSARRSPEVAALRRSKPYYGYAAPILRLPVQSEGSDTASPVAGWTGLQGYGARHRLDLAPFSLWEDEKGDFRLPTELEADWLITKFRPMTISYHFPIIVIETGYPPNPLPLTVACVGVKFIPPPTTFTLTETGIRTNVPRDARPTHFSTNYLGVRGPPDPLNFKLKKWMQPTDDQLQTILQALFEFCNPRLVHILCPYIIVELYHDDGRTYEPGSLPCQMGGYALSYHHQEESVFKGFSARARPIKPDPLIQDTSNYLSMFDEICPGVRVTSATIADDGSHLPGSMSTTAGILLRDNHGNQRLTVSNHGFQNRKDVFHPTETSNPIGEIDERWEHLDIALVKLNPSINFTNKTYFEAKAPRRLLSSHEIPYGVYFSVDGMSTGVVFMQAEGTTMEIPRRPPRMTKIKYVEWKIYRGFGNTEAVPREGMCGAAFVADNSNEGGVAGFFQLGDDSFAMTPVLDEMIACSWSVV